jgi:hypothetical protein
MEPNKNNVRRNRFQLELVALPAEQQPRYTSTVRVFFVEFERLLEAGERGR